MPLERGKGKVMTKKQLRETGKAADAALSTLLDQMTDVLAKNGIKGVQVCSFEISPTVPPPVVRAMGTPPRRGCVILPNGTIFCG